MTASGSTIALQRPSPDVIRSVHNPYLSSTAVLTDCRVVWPGRKSLQILCFLLPSSRLQPCRALALANHQVMGESHSVQSTGECVGAIPLWSSRELMRHSVLPQPSTHSNSSQPIPFNFTSITLKLPYPTTSLSPRTRR
jgi:hypothetical protein